MNVDTMMKPLGGSLPWLLALLLLSGLGVSLQPMSVLVPLQLLVFYHSFRLVYVHKSTLARRLVTLLFFIVYAAAAWTLGNVTVFNFHGWRWINLLYVYTVALGIFTFLTTFSLLPALACESKLPRAWILPLIWPACWTSCLILISMSPFVTFGNPTYSLLDYRPVALTASFFGVHGICLMLCVIVSVSVWRLDPVWPGLRGAYRQQGVVAGALVVGMLAVGGALQYHDTFPQRSISRLDVPMLQATCLQNRAKSHHSHAISELLARSSERISAGDDIVIWSETAVRVRTAEREEALLDEAKAMLATAQQKSPHRTHLAITYGVYNSTHSDGRNMFTLLSPDGEELWRYQKAHPVPVAEDGTIPGPNVMPVTEAIFSGDKKVKLGGGICFDLDSLSFTRQAGWNKVDLVLQPAETWGSIGSLEFHANALRAVENGFTLLRCSSNGYSGVVDPYYNFYYYRPSFSTGEQTYSVPLLGWRRTVYSAWGHLLEWGVLVMGFVFWGLAVCPERYIRLWRGSNPETGMWIILGVGGNEGALEGSGDDDDAEKEGSGESLREPLLSETAGSHS